MKKLPAKKTTSPTKGKTPAKQLEREIEEALRAPKIPSLVVTDVHPYRVDEWYGVQANFRWTKPFDAAAFHRAAREEQNAWFKSNPQRVMVGGTDLEKAIGDHIKREVLRSPQWAAFYAKPQRVPRFTDIDDWHFNDVGGTASASTRDSDEGYDDDDDDY